MSLHDFLTRYKIKTNDIFIRFVLGIIAVIFSALTYSAITAESHVACSDRVATSRGYTCLGDDEVVTGANIEKVIFFAVISIWTAWSSVTLNDEDDVEIA